jgi:hypothetical protein
MTCKTCHAFSLLSSRYLIGIAIAIGIGIGIEIANRIEIAIGIELCASVKLKIFRVLLPSPFDPDSDPEFGLDKSRPNIMICALAACGCPGPRGTTY